MPDLKVKKRNTPIATLIKNFLNKKSGKVTDSRDEIQTRFDCLDRKDQKKIMHAFLDSGKGDRQWVYMKLLDNWDKSFETKVLQLWNELHENRCAWIIIRHFPLEYLSQNIEKFTGYRNYFFICLRLAKNKDYVIDKSRLSPTDYLAVLYHSDRTLAEEEANDMLYRIVHKRCIKGLPLYEELDRYFDDDRGKIISPVRFREVSVAIYYLKKLNCNHTVAAFENWNHEVETTIYASPEFKRLAETNIDDFADRQERIRIARKYAYLALDEKYKEPSDPDIDEVLKQRYFFYETSDGEIQHVASTPAGFVMLGDMMTNNPALEQLVSNLELAADIPY